MTRTLGATLLLATAATTLAAAPQRATQQAAGSTSAASASSARSTASSESTSETSSSSTIVHGDVGVTVTKRVKTTTDREGNTKREETSEVKATLNGEDVPSDRVRQKGTTIEILDEKGAVIRTVQAPSIEDNIIIGTSDLLGDGKRLRVFTHGGATGSARARSSATGGSSAGSGQSATPLAQTAPPPKVMLGVTMESPDLATAQQLKVNPNEVTLIIDVTPELPAAKAGVEAHDIVVSIDGSKPADPSRMREVLKSKEPGDALKLGLIRGGASKEATITLEAWDANRLGIVDQAMSGFLLDPSMGFSQLDAEARAQIEAMMRQFEDQLEKQFDSQFAQQFMGQLGQHGAHFPDGWRLQLFAPAPGGSGQPAFQFRVPSTPGASAPAAPAAPGATVNEDRIRQLEERIEQLNQTIRKLEERLQGR